MSQCSSCGLQRRVDLQIEDWESRAASIFGAEGNILQTNTDLRYRLNATVYLIWFRWENNIKMDTREIRFQSVDCIHLTQYMDRWLALVSTVMNIAVPKRQAISWLSEFAIIFSKRTLIHGVGQLSSHLDYQRLK